TVRIRDSSSYAPLTTSRRMSTSRNNGLATNLRLFSHIQDIRAVKVADPARHEVSGHAAVQLFDKGIDDLLTIRRLEFGIHVESLRKSAVKSEAPRESLDSAGREKQRWLLETTKYANQALPG